MKDLHDKIIKALKERYTGGMATDTIAKQFGLTNRQVGAIMGHLSRQGRVFTYTKGYVTIKSSPCSNSAPMGLTNSFYEWVNGHPLNDNI